MIELQLDLLPDPLKRRRRPDWVRTGIVSLLVILVMLAGALVALRVIQRRVAPSEAAYLRARLALYRPRALEAVRLEALLSSAAFDRRAGLVVTAAGRLEQRAAAAAPRGVHIAVWQYTRSRLEITVSAPTMLSAAAFVTALERAHILLAPRVLAVTGAKPVQVVVAGGAGTP